MTRQYVGARYVPKFAEPIEWNKNRSYEALEIVTYLGSSYTSKKPVPVNTEITDSEYWVVTGNYNSQVESYRQEVEEVSSAVTSINSRVTDIESKYGNINYLHGKKILIFGDSISDQVSQSVQSLRPNWVDRLEAKIPDDCTIDNGYSLAGRFITGSNGIAHLMQGLDADNMACDILIVFAGVNDFRHGRTITDGTDSDWTTLIGALKIIRSRIFTNCPNANVFFVSPLKNFETSYPDDYKTDSPLIMYRNTIYNYCCQSGFTYIDGYSAPMLDPVYPVIKNLYQPDGLHPNSAYSPLLCEFIYNKILENTNVKPIKETVRISADYCVTGFSSSYTYFDVDSDGTCHFSAAINGTFEENVSTVIMRIPCQFTPNNAVTVPVRIIGLSKSVTGYLALSGSVVDGYSNVSIISTESIGGTIAIYCDYKPICMNSLMSASV